MDVVLSLVIVAVLLGVLLIVRRQKPSGNRRPPAPRPKSAKADSAFHAVSIFYASNACESAKNMQGRRFLSSAAPKLPLPECNALECKCRFVHHKDRRKGADRRNPYLHQFGGGETGTHQQEQRKSRERRDDPPDSF
jgi:hypothetical protein